MRYTPQPLCPHRAGAGSDCVLFLVLLILGLLALSGFFSGSETALFALSRHEVSQLRKDAKPSHRLVAQLLEHPRKLLLTLMIGNVTLNMFVFAASLALFQQISTRHSYLAPILGLISPIVLTLLGDIMPKGLAILMGNRMAIRSAPLIRLAQIILTPFSIALNAIVTPLTRLLVAHHEPDEYVTVDELHQLIQMSERHRIINADENAMLSEVIQLDRLKVRDVMVPRVDMVAFEIHDDPDQLRRIMRERGFTRIPVYDTTIDNILGMIYAKELFLLAHRPLATMVRPIHFVPEMITLTQLLKHFRERRSQVAIVVDEFGGVTGIVTIEDVAEQIVGELSMPGEATEQALWQKLDDRRYRVSGSVNIRDWAQQFHVRRFDERVTTLGGLMMARLGRPPGKGDQVRLGNLRLTVESLVGRRIDWVLLELLDGKSQPQAPDPAGRST